MKLMTAAEVALSFKDVLDQIERGETIVITCDGSRVATISPTPAANGRALIDAFRGWTPVDDPDLEADMAVARSLVNSGFDRDPWGDDALSSPDATPAD